MDGSIIIVLLIAGWAILYSRKKHHNAAAAPQQPVVAHSVPPPSTQLTPEENEVERARRINEEHESARQDAYNNHRTALRDAEAKVAKANEYVKTTGLGLAVPYLWEEMHHWPSWLVNHQDQWQCPVPVTEVSGHTEGASQGHVQWRWKDSLFCIRFEKPQYYGPDDSDLECANFAVEVDGAEVLKISCSRNFIERTKQFATWRFGSVDALKVGPWMSVFMDYSGVVRAAKDAEHAEWEAEYTQGEASRIDFGEN